MFNFKLKRDINTIFSQCKPVGFQNKLLGGTDGPIRVSCRKNSIILGGRRRNFSQNDTESVDVCCYDHHLGLQSSRTKVISPEVMLPETRVMSPKIYSHVARYFESWNLIMLKKILKKCWSEWNVKLWNSGCSFRCLFYGDSKPKIKN